MVGQITINGAFNGQSGILTIPSALPDSINAFLNQYAGGMASSIYGGMVGYADYNPALGDTVNSGGPAFPAVFEISNFNSVGGITNGPAMTNSVSVPASATSLWVEFPGVVTVDGSAFTNLALFGANSDVTYNVTGGFSSIYAAGGKDVISVGGGSLSGEYITTGGSDTVFLSGPTGSTGNVNAVGNATTSVFVANSDNATVTASDSAVASVAFLPGAGGNLDFINNSTQAQTVYGGTYIINGNVVYANNAVTAWGGNAGGFFVGGRAGFNSLVGGAGNVTLVGGGAQDLLSASGANNLLYTGQGEESLIGGGGSNDFFVGFENYGIGTVKAVGDLVSAGGSGSQNFLIGQASSTTLTGSTVSGASNIYNVLGTYTTLGGQEVSITGGDFTITDFGAHDAIWLINGSGTFDSGAPTVETVGSALGGGGSQILLSDGTTITLKGVSTSQIAVANNGHEIYRQ
ncbi:hypothetical protein [Acidocella sp.]|uniref:hypothetical protein n=1 Tax=Acidocella sp. TaxID=50710 RepID=UPI0026024704|nr:hypothetical protein [Acidocella sp.]